MSEIRKKFLASLVSNGTSSRDNEPAPSETVDPKKEDNEKKAAPMGAQIRFELSSLRQFCGMAVNMKSFKKERPKATKRPNYINSRRRRLAFAKRTKHVQQLGWSR